MFSYVLCTTVVHSHKHTHIKGFYKWIIEPVGLDLGLLFVRVLCFFYAIIMQFFSELVLCCVVGCHEFGSQEAAPSRLAITRASKS